MIAQPLFSSLHNNFQEIDKEGNEIPDIQRSLILILCQRTRRDPYIMSYTDTTGPHILSHTNLKQAFTCFQEESQTGLRIVSNRSPTLAFVFSSSRIVETFILCPKWIHPRGPRRLSNKDPKEASIFCPTRIPKGLHISFQRNPKQACIFCPKRTRKRSSHSVSKEPQRSEAFTVCTKGAPNRPTRSFLKEPKQPQRGLHVLSQRSPKEDFTFCIRGIQKRASYSVQYESLSPSLCLTESPSQNVVQHIWSSKWILTYSIMLTVHIQSCWRT